jgi:DNA-binding PadR family transcriptional regulator
MKNSKKTDSKELLTKLEELILLSVLKLGDNAYGTTLYKYIKELTGKNLSLGGVYFPLDRLTQRGYLASFTGQATPERRGLSKRYYRLTPKGITALNEIHRVNNILWADYSILAGRIND